MYTHEDICVCIYIYIETYIHINKYMCTWETFLN